MGSLLELIAYPDITPRGKRWAVFVESGLMHWSEDSCMVCGVVEFCESDHADAFERLLVDECASVFQCVRDTSNRVRFRVKYWDNTVPFKATRLTREIQFRMNGLFRGCMNSRTLVMAISDASNGPTGSSQWSLVDHKLPTASTVEWEPDCEKYGERHAAVIDLNKYDSILVTTNGLVRVDLKKQDIDRVLSCGMRYLPIWLFGPRIDDIKGEAIRANPPRPPFSYSTPPSLQALAARAVRRVPGWDRKLAPLLPLAAQRTLYKY